MGNWREKERECVCVCVCVNDHHSVSCVRRRWFRRYYLGRCFGWWWTWFNFFVQSECKGSSNLVGFSFRWSVVIKSCFRRCSLACIFLHKWYRIDYSHLLDSVSLCLYMLHLASKSTHYYLLFTFAINVSWIIGITPVQKRDACCETSNTSYSRNLHITPSGQSIMLSVILKTIDICIISSSPLITNAGLVYLQLWMSPIIWNFRANSRSFPALDMALVNRSSINLGKSRNSLF